MHLKPRLQICGLRADGYSNFLHTSACTTHAKERSGKRETINYTARASNLTQDLHRKHCSFLRKSNAFNRLKIPNKESISQQTPADSISLTRREDDKDNTRSEIIIACRVV